MADARLARADGAPAPPVDVAWATHDFVVAVMAAPLLTVRWPGRGVRCAAAEFLTTCCRMAVDPDADEAARAAALNAILVFPKLVFGPGREHCAALEALKAGGAAVTALFDCAVGRLSPERRPMDLVRAATDRVHAGQITAALRLVADVDRTAVVSRERLPDVVRDALPVRGGALAREVGAALGLGDDELAWLRYSGEEYSPDYARAIRRAHHAKSPGPDGWRAEQLHALAAAFPPLVPALAAMLTGFDALGVPAGAAPLFAAVRAVGFEKPARPDGDVRYRVLAVGNLWTRLWTHAHAVCIAARVAPLLAAVGQYGVGVPDGSLRAHAVAQEGFDAGDVAVKADYEKGYDRMHGPSAVAAVRTAAPGRLLPLQFLSGLRTSLPAELLWQWMPS